MIILFQILNSIFLFFTLLMGAFLLRGDIIFGPEVALMMKSILMPAYLIFCGVMIGYLVGIIRIGKEEYSEVLHKKEKIYKNSFLIGILVGLVLALSYIFL